MYKILQKDQAKNWSMYEIPESGDVWESEDLQQGLQLFRNMLAVVPISGIKLINEVDVNVFAAAYIPTIVTVTGTKVIYRGEKLRVKFTLNGEIYALVDYDPTFKTRFTEFLEEKGCANVEFSPTGGVTATAPEGGEVVGSFLLKRGDLKLYNTEVKKQNAINEDYLVTFTQQPSEGGEDEGPELVEIVEDLINLQATSLQLGFLFPNENEVVDNYLAANYVIADFKPELRQRVVAYMQSLGCTNVHLEQWSGLTAEFPLGTDFSDAEFTVGEGEIFLYNSITKRLGYVNAEHTVRLAQ